MWSSEKFQEYSRQNSAQPFIIHYETENNFIALTFEEVCYLSSMFKINISKIIPNKWQCIGLFMHFNQFIPSIILSLLNNHSFIFLNPSKNNEEITEIINEVGIQWIITYKTCIEPLGFKNNHVSSLNQDLDLNYLDLNKNQQYEFNDIAYVVCTSGTTEKVKLVRVQNYCIFSNISSLRSVFNVDNNDVIYCGTPLSFDPVFVELFLALTVPCTLVSAAQKIKLNPTKVYKIFSQTNVTILQVVPSVFFRWDEDIIANILSTSSLKVLAFGGEKFPKSIFNFKVNENLSIFNLYGITELSCWASACKILKGDEITLGTALSDTLLEVRNKNGKKIDEGEGELFVGSNSRLCLVNDESFDVVKPVFRATGDLVKVISEKMFFLSRKNNIVKRFGNKVNLNVIEEEIFLKIGLSSAVIWSESNQKLLAFILLKTAYPEVKLKTVDNIRRKLMHLLSKEMYPDLIDIISVFPLTNNGKINKKALLESYSLSCNENNGDFAELFKILWAKNLGLGFHNLETYKDFNFFDMGGTSFMYLHFLNEFEDAAKMKVSEELNNLILNSSFGEVYNYVASNFSKFNKRKFGNEKVFKNSKFKLNESNKTVEINLKWCYDLRGCVYSSPEVIKFNNQVLVLCVSFYQVFAIINLNTGKMIAETIFPEPVQGGICVGNEGKAYVGCLDGLMYCIDIGNCQKVWSYKTNDIIKCKACFSLEQKAIIFGSYDGHAYCISSDSGHLLWKTNFKSSVSVTPVYNSELKNIYVSASNKICYCLNENDGKIMWTYSVNSPLLGSPCMCKSGSQDCILWPEVEGIIHCTKCTTGELLWKYTAGNQIYSSIINFGNYFIFGCKDKDIYCVHIIDESKCNLSFKTTLDSEITPTPSVLKFKNSTYLVAAANCGVVYLINFSDKNIVQKIKLNEEIFCSPVVYENYILFGCNDNNIYCFSVNNV